MDRLITFNNPDRQSPKDTEQLANFSEALNFFKYFCKKNNLPWFIANGGGVLLYSQLLGKMRIPTDLDIVIPGVDLIKLNQELTVEQYPNLQCSYKPDPVQKWGYTYHDPQIKAYLNGFQIDVLTSSSIIKTTSEGSFNFKPDYQNLLILNNLRNLGNDIPVPPLEVLFLTKQFQLREEPKQDRLDLQLIKLITSIYPNLWSQDLYRYMSENWIKKI